MNHSQPKLKSILMATLNVFVLAGCAEKLVNITIVDQKTTLENQILGSCEKLSNEVLLLGSVRSLDEDGKLKPATEIPRSKLKAVRAMQRQEFNRDDIQEFKQTLCAREGNDGFPKFFENDRTEYDPRLKEFAATIIAEENEDRLTILKIILATNEKLV